MWSRVYLMVGRPSVHLPFLTAVALASGFAAKHPAGRRYGLTAVGAMYQLQAGLLAATATQQGA